VQRCASGHVGTLHCWEISAELTFLNKARVLACRVRRRLERKPIPSRQAWVSRLSPERGAPPPLKIRGSEAKTRAQKNAPRERERLFERMRRKIARAFVLILRSARTREVRQTQSRVRASRRVRTAPACALMLRDASQRAAPVETFVLVRAAMLLSMRAKVRGAFSAPSLSPLRRLELGGNPLGARVMAREISDERARGFRHCAVR